MQQGDRKEFARLVTDVHAYYRQDCTPFVLDVWWAGCEPFELEQVRAAMTAHAKDPEAGRFCPKLADVVKVLQGTSTDRATLAWGQVMQAIGAVGAYRDVDFGDPATHAAIHDLGGWPKVCRTELKELGYLQHRFCEAYRGYSARGVAECPLVLMGDRSPDAEYERKGLLAPVAKLVGRRRCADVIARRIAAGDAAPPIALPPAKRPPQGDAHA